MERRQLIKAPQNQKESENSRCTLEWKFPPWSKHNFLQVSFVLEMGVKSKFHLFLMLIVFFLHRCALTRAQNFQREKHGLSFAKFLKEKDSSVKLNSAFKLASLMVSKLGECTFECINNQECYSVNFGRNSPDARKHSCELLEKDKFRQPSGLVISDDFDHYYIKVSLGNWIWFDQPVV